MTVFSNGTKSVTLGEINSLLDDGDRVRGYVLKEELLNLFGNQIKIEDINEHSVITVYQWTSYNTNDDMIILEQLPVR